jgi:hypothetical protein
MRPEGWEEALAAAIEAARGRRWRWGAHDCATFAHGCAAAVLGGPTPWDGWALGTDGRPVWRCRRSAERALRALGGLPAAMDLGAARLPSPLLARRGDVVALPGARGEPCLGVAEGAHAWVAAPAGLDRAPLAAATAAWPVG